MTARWFATWSFAVLSAAASGAADGPPGAFAVGALRRDGIVVPFATFDGKRWTDSWPAPARDLTVPVNTRAVPSRWWGATGPLDVWYARGPGVDHDLPLRVVQPDWVDVPCARQIGLRTDYVTSLGVPPPATQPYPKDGLAISPPHAVDAIAILPAEGSEAQLMTRALIEPFNAAERKVEQRFGHPVVRRRREGVLPTIEAIYAYGDAPRVYYVEAVRPYREIGKPDSCSAVAFGTGWFAREGGEVRSLLTVVDLLGCDRAGASYMLPLGVVREHSRLFWLAQFSGWDHERFLVAEIKPTAVERILSVWGGGC